MVEAFFASLLLWIGFLFFTAVTVLVAVVVAYYGLKLIDKTERHFKGLDHDEPPK